MTDKLQIAFDAFMKTQQTGVQAIIGDAIDQGRQSVVRDAFMAGATLSLPDAAQDKTITDTEISALSLEHGIRTGMLAGGTGVVYCWPEDFLPFCRALLAMRAAPPAQPDAQPVLSNGLSQEDGERYAALEREHLGDPDKQTGIYHPDVIAASKLSMSKFATVADYEAARKAQAAQAQDEPVAEVGKGPVAAFIHLADRGRALPPGKYDLYTRPQLPAMSDAEIREIWFNAGDMNDDPEEAVKFARALGVPAKGE